MESISSNLSSFVNLTESIDLFCTNMLVGPLIWGILSVPCAFVGLPASVWLLWVITKGKKNGAANTTYMLNLTIMDLIFNISIIPTTVNYFYWKNNQYLNFGIILYCFNLTGRPLFSACICVDCYMAVVCPVLFLKIKDTRYRLVVSLFVWSFTMVYGTFITKLYNELITATYIPCAFAVLIITFCDVVILRTLRNPDPSGRSDIHPQKQRALQTITNSLIMTLLSYLPMTILNTLSVMLPLSLEEVTCYVTVPGLIASILGSTVMALLHLENLGSFKDLKCFLRACNH